MIQYYFDKHRTNEDNEFWVVVQTNGLLRFVDTSGVRIHTFAELKTKIQDLLRKMGYDDVNEIPQGMSVEYRM